MVAAAKSANDMFREWLAATPAELRDRDGIKAQYGAAAALVMFLRAQHPDGGWSFEPTEVGGWEDRDGIDGYLVCTGKDVRYPVDFSLEAAGNPRGHKANAPWLVHLDRAWFDVAADGFWALRPRCMTLLAQAFLPVLKNGPSAWRVSRAQ
jgi:hypothetical protein